MSVYFVLNLFACKRKHYSLNIHVEDKYKGSVMSNFVKQSTIFDRMKVDGQIPYLAHQMTLNERNIHVHVILVM